MLEISEDLIATLDAGGSLVVPSPQRAAAVQLAYSTRQLARGHSAWRTPDVRAFTPWLEWQAARARDAGQRLPRALHAAEEWWLWRECAQVALGEVGLSGADLQLEALRRAARLLTDWHIPAAVLRRSGSPESELLARALERFTARCAELDAAPSYRLPQLLTGAAPSRPVRLVGFLDRSPARAALIEAWRDRGASIEEPAPAQAPAATLERIAARDAAHELELAASWCRSQLAHDPRRRLLVILADLAQRRDEVARVFAQTLTPQSALGRVGAEGASFAIEGGQSLADFPLVRHALVTLRLLTSTLEPAQVSSWLRAAFWSEPTAAERARLDASLRRLLAADTGAVALGAALTGIASAAAARVRERLEAAARVLETQGPEATLHSWGLRFAAVLQGLGWPGSRALDSAEEQTRLRFAEVLAEWAGLAPHLGAVPAARAAALLESLLRRTSFEPASGDPAVTLSAAWTDPVVRYDGIWVAGLHAEGWPPPARIDPFIPLAAQRAAGVPTASAPAVLAHARTLQGLWRQRAAELIVSWPGEDAERHYSASPLLAELPGLTDRPVQSTTRSLPAQLRDARRIVSVSDARGARWSGTRLPAGARLIELQSRCAFRAHAELRLAATALESAHPGIDRRERGRLLHRALEFLWQRLGSQRELKAQHSAGALQGLIEACVGRAAMVELAPAAAGARAGALARERRRAARLIHALCELELTRGPFRAHAVEAQRVLQLAGVELAVRIDRIDALEDGTSVILDYKTGKPKALDWLTERLTEPQLLVYQAAAGAEVTALAAAYLTAGHTVYRGLADRPGRLPRIDVLTPSEGRDATAAWRAQSVRWRTALEQLVENFLEGVAALDPAPHACQSCHLHALCRIADAAPGLQSGPESAAQSADD